jgi:hypothetical protein
MQLNPSQDISSTRIANLLTLDWVRYRLADLQSALSASNCLYVWHHPDDDDRPQYIGKAKFFGTRQSTGYRSSARYNSGYEYLLELALRGGTNLYIAKLSPENFTNAESFEQALIEKWQPLRKQKRKATPEVQFSTVKPWSAR